MPREYAVKFTYRQCVNCSYAALPNGGDLINGLNRDCGIFFTLAHYSGTKGHKYKFFKKRVVGPRKKNFVV